MTAGFFEDEATSVPSDATGYGYIPELPTEKDLRILSMDMATRSRPGGFDTLDELFTAADRIAHYLETGEFGDSSANHQPL